MTSDGMQKARRAAGGRDAGGRDADIARLLGITPSAVSRWNGVVPPARAIELEALTRGRVTRYEIRPDHFGPPFEPESGPAVTAGERRAA